VTLAEGFARTVAWLDDHGRIADSDADPLDDRIVTAWRAMIERAERELAPLDPLVERPPGGGVSSAGRCRRRLSGRGQRWRA
jgi:hypothetical protein